MPDDPRTTVYQTICSSYNAITDWRAKLLGFLPLASGAGIFFLLNNSFTNVTTQGKSTIIDTPIIHYLLPIGLVGAFVSFGLFVYDLRAIQVRHSLVEAGKAIEHDLEINDGPFTKRPDSYAHFFNDLGGSSLIYFTIIAGWIFFGLVFTDSQTAWRLAIGVFVVGVIGVYLGNLVIIRQRKHKPLTTTPADQSSTAAPPPTSAAP